MLADPDLWRRAAAVIADRMGLHFPDDRLADLRRGFDEAALDFGFEDGCACARHLLAGRLDDAQISTIASHLTIGETYFFRGDETFAALAGHVLPVLAEARRRGDKRLRIWSAACCTGEEAYSLAILLRQELPDIDDWHITILATDINVRFLKRAAEGVYGQWSFRGTPAGFRERWFRARSDKRYQIMPEVRQMVTFAPLNLVEGAIPSLATNTNAMDLVLCRNVLMYFAPEQAKRVVESLRRSLRSDGWLVVAPCEISQTLFAGFTPVTFDGAILYRSGAARMPPPVAKTSMSAPQLDARPPPPAPPTSTGARRLGLRLRAVRSCGDGGVAMPAAPTAGGNGKSVRNTAGTAHALANRGELSEALAHCDRWVAAEKTNPEAHYLRAMVLTERGELGEARNALQRSLYLAPDVAMTCFAAGNLERALGRPMSAAMHYRHTLQVLERASPHSELPHSEGVTAAQLAALVKDLLLAEAG